MHRPKDSRITKILSDTLPLWALVAVFATSFANYLIFHSIAEIVSLVVAGAIFMLAWNTRAIAQNRYLLVVGYTFPFIALVDMLHTLAYPGMGVFPGNNQTLSTQLWVIARFLGALALVIAPLALAYRIRLRVIVVGYCAATAFLLALIYPWQIFPVTFIPGEGLTPFKQAAEGLIMILFLAALSLLWGKRAEFSRNVLNLLLAAIGISIAAELFFTFYLTFTDMLTRLGHIFRLGAYLLIYKALVDTGLSQPYALLFRELKESETHLKAQAAVLMARNEELDAYAQTVAHDLQNPLASILMACQVMRNPNLPAQERLELADEIAATANRMSSIIDALMLLADLHQEDIPRTAVEMGPLIENIKRRQYGLIREKQAEIRLPPRWPAALGYAPWVEEVWANYISNALKYGGQPPRVELGGEALPDGRVRYWVRDYGPGIDTTAHPDLFEPGFRIQRLTRGHGLGLSIVRRVMDKLGGQAGVDSAPGEGSTFYFILPGA